MFQMLKKIFHTFTRRERYFFGILLFLLFAAANLELLGIGLVLPVIALLTNPALIRQNKYLSLCHDILNPATPEQFLLILCFVIAGVYVVKNIYLACLTYWQSRLINNKVCALNWQLFRTYMYAPYELFLERSSAELHSNIVIANHWFNVVLVAVMMILTEVLNVLMIFGMLFFFVPWATLLLIGVSLFFSFLIYFPLRKVNGRIGAEQNWYSEKTASNHFQAFGGIKEVKIRKSEECFIEREGELIWKSGKVTSKIQLLGQLPRFLLESGMVAGGMILLAIYLMTGTASTSIVLKLTLIGTAIVRLMPSLSRIQYYLSSLRQSNDALEKYFYDMETIPEEMIPSDMAEDLPFRKEITLSHVSFAYRQGTGNVISDLSLTIPVNSSTAFVGKTGCGKTTLVDLIAGLLVPSSGKILADGKDIRSNLGAWRARIGYVSQSIFIMDDSILANVTLGIRAQEVDEAQVWNCLRMAQLEDFVRSLPDGLNTRLGERGCRLSGGQRQRIGIARALYSRPVILILDEATSALDMETEAAFMDAVRTLHGKLTLLIVAHRLSTTEGCDKIINLGKI